MEGIVPHVNLLGYVAAQAAYENGGAWHEQLLDYLRGNRDLVEREIASMPGLSVTHVEATYLAWIDARGSGLADPAKDFEKAGVGLSDGADFGSPGLRPAQLRLPPGTAGGGAAADAAALLPG